MESLDRTPVLLKITGVLKKFKTREDGHSWTDEEIDAGLADDYLYETVIIEDETWA